MSADVLLHINETMSDDRMQQVVNEISALGGVSGVSRDPKHEHLVNVSYDPDSIHAKAVLGVTDKHGYHAQLVGL